MVDKRRIWLRFIRYVMWHLRVCPWYVPVKTKSIGYINSELGTLDFDDELFLARIDVSRALAAGCASAEEIYEFLRIEEEGWFFEEDVKRMMEVLEVVEEG